MRNLISICIFLFIPVSVFAQSSTWENWNKYYAILDYGPSTTYVNMRSRSIVSANPRIYSFDARLEEDGSTPEEVYKLLVHCTNRKFMTLHRYSSRNWTQATGKYARLVQDACR